MNRRYVSMQAAKRNFVQLVARVERGERIVIARAGKPVAELVPTKVGKKASLQPSDPLLNLDDFAFDGQGGELTNAEIDRLVYGRR